MILATLFLSLLLPIVAQNGEDQIVRLRDGRLLVGSILEHDLDGLVLITARDGGRYPLTWSNLFPGEADRLRESFGYRNQTEIPMTTAHRILLQNGREIIGRILREDTLNLEIRVRDTTSLVPKRRLAAPPEEIVVEAARILTPEQFYAERLPQVDADNRFKEFDFAQELEVMFALEQAKTHYQLAADLAKMEQDDDLAKRVVGALVQLEKTIANREEAQKLDAIRLLMNRERFTLAEKELEDFGKFYPQSPLRGEYLQLADLFEGRRKASVTRYLKRHWFHRVSKLLKLRALNRDVEVDQLISWLETDVPLLVRQQLLEEIKDQNNHLDVSGIDSLWAARLDQGASAYTAGFNDGTWILGEDRARAGLVDNEEKKVDSRSAQQREMEERMKRYMDNLEAKRRAASASSQDVSPEDWWRRATVSQRFQWMLAYYSEFSGDYSVLTVKFSYCSTCAGHGYIEVVDIGQSGAKQRKRKCPTCHGVQVRRSINFK